MSNSIWRFGVIAAVFSVACGAQRSPAGGSASDEEMTEEDGGPPAAEEPGVACKEGGAEPPGVTMTFWGRFGNQVLEYAFIRMYADRHGLRPEVPGWYGNAFFDLNDVGKHLPYCNTVRESPAVMDSFHKRSDTVYANYEINGFFQAFHTSEYAKDKDYFRSLFKIRPHILSILTPGLERLRSKGNTIVGVHLRRGDFAGHSPPYSIVPNEWYIASLEKLWPHLDKPVLYLASDEPEAVVNAFRKFSPVTAKDLNVSIPVDGGDFFIDYYILTQVDYLAVSNSTFSTSAAVINQRAKEFYRPSFRLKGLIEYDPWNFLYISHD